MIHHLGEDLVVIKVHQVLFDEVLVLAFWKFVLSVVFSVFLDFLVFLLLILIVLALFRAWYNPG